MRSLLLVVVTPFLAAAQVQLAEESPAGTVIRNELTLQLSGKMKFDRDGKLETAPLEATGKHSYIERNESSMRSLRYYFEARSNVAAGVERGERKLGGKHRLIVVERTSKSASSFSLAGPLTRDELSLVAEHFDAMSVGGLLPGTMVNIGDTWPIRDEIVCKLCLFDGVIKQSLAGKLAELKGRVAVVGIEGEAEGVENGAKVKLAIKATAQFHLDRKRIESLVWDQSDDREQGPVSPALEAKAKVTLTRALEAGESKELAAAKVPLEGKVPKELLQLYYRHPGDAFELFHDRCWHPVVQTETHLVLRMVLNGELISQATITPWKKADPKFDRETANREFVEATAKQPGWTPEKVIASGEFADPDGPLLYRHSADGKQDGLTVMQAFYRVTASDQRQAVLTSVTRAEQVEKLGSQDALLAKAIRFPAAK